MHELINNNWFISIVSSLITIAIVPIIGFIVNNIRAHYGIFSGTYIAITEMPDSKDLIIELIKCKHIKNTLKGKIFGVSFKTINQNTTNNSNKYTFKGGVAERLLVISYNSDHKGDLSSGSLTLYGNTTGNIFTGIWGGLEDSKVVSSSCVWIKSNKKLHYQKDHDAILEIVNKRNSKDFFIIQSDNISGKSNLAKGFSFDDFKNK
ncbi:MAG: hypothetical protein ABI402_15555 [Ferruginibacter sp.]